MARETFPCTVAEESSIAVYDDGDCWVLEAGDHLYKLLPDEAKLLGQRIRNFLDGEDFDFMSRPGGFDLECAVEDGVALVDSRDRAYCLDLVDAIIIADMLDPEGAKEAGA